MTTNVTTGLTPTDMSNFEYCERLFQLAKRYPHQRAPHSAPVVWGLVEHDVYRILASSLKQAWRQARSATAIPSLSLPEIRMAIEFADKLICQNYPEFKLKFDRQLLELRYRLNIWVNQCSREIETTIQAGHTMEYAISKVLPWKVEDNLRSKELGLHGRTDRLYSDGHALVPEDIKTHNARFKTLLYTSAHKTQLVCYSVMAEEQYGLPSSESRVFFAQDLLSVPFPITKTDKLALKKKVSRARELQTSELLPVLSGEDAIKCDYCYARELCLSVQRAKDEELEADWLDHLILSKSDSLDSLGGGAK